MERTRTVFWLTLIYICSGACSLIDEVVWVRLIKLVLGNTTYAAGIVVATFLAGLALGSLIMGRRVHRIRNPLRLYAILETCITLSALGMPPALRVADSVYGWAFRTYGPSPSVMLSV